jgi:heat shock protein HslJ
MAVAMRMLWTGVLALLTFSGLGITVGSRAQAATQPASSMPAPRYTVQFLPTGLVDILADCNRAGGTWSGGDGVLTMAVTTSTLAFCPPDSISEPYLQALNSVTGYTVTGPTLVLHSAAGDLTFTQ